MTSKERVLAALRLEKHDRVPFMEWWFDNEIGEEFLAGKNIPEKKSPKRYVWTV